MTTNLMAASNQWANRPDDERYESVPSMLAAAVRKKERAVENTLKLGTCKVEAISEDGIVLKRPGLPDSVLSNLAFQQLCTRLDYPVSGIVGKVNAPIAADILNHRLRSVDPESEVITLADADPNAVSIRSVTTEKYARFWDADVIRDGLLNMERRGWIVPPARPAFAGQKGSRPATEDDVARMGKHTNVAVGDMIAPAGLYMGDKDMFALMVNPGTETDRGDGHGICRASMIWNSEVGTKTFGRMDCVLDYVCGNHILWNVSEIKMVRYRHIGDAVDRIKSELGKIQEAGVRPLDREIAIIQAAKRYSLGDTKDTVVDNIYKLRLDPTITQSLLGGSIENAARYRQDDGDPYTLGGLVGAMTRFSQESGNADNRWKIDTAAAKVMTHFVDKGLVTV